MDTLMPLSKHLPGSKDSMSKTGIKEWLTVDRWRQSSLVLDLEPRKILSLMSICKAMLETSKHWVNFLIEIGKITYQLTVSSSPCCR
jgi:hypothetical protein